MQKYFLLFLLAVGCSSSKSSPRVVYLAFGGGIFEKTKFSPYQSPYQTEYQDEADIVNLLRQIFYGYSIEFTTYPPDVKHDTILFSGTPDKINEAPNILGKAPLDCVDANYDTLIVFSDAFASWANPDGSDRIAFELGLSTTAAHELGHTFGLQHTDNPFDLMYGFSGPAQTFGVGRVVYPNVCKSNVIQNSPLKLEEILETCDTCRWPPETGKIAALGEGSPFD